MPGIFFGFKESDWCCQEVGFALGRDIDIIPLLAGLEPFGFFGEYQGIQVKGKLPQGVADDIVLLLFKKPKFRDKIIRGMSKAINSFASEKRLKTIEKVRSWSVATDEQFRMLIEGVSLSAFEKGKLRTIIREVRAFENVGASGGDIDEDNIPF